MSTDKHLEKVRQLREAEIRDHEELGQVKGWFLNEYIPWTIAQMEAGGRDPSKIELRRRDMLATAQNPNFIPDYLPIMRAWKERYHKEPSPHEQG